MQNNERRHVEMANVYELQTELQTIRFLADETLPPSDGKNRFLYYLDEMIKKEKESLPTLTK